MLIIVHNVKCFDYCILVSENENKNSPTWWSGPPVAAAADTLASLCSWCSLSIALWMAADACFKMVCLS